MSVINKVTRIHPFSDRVVVTRESPQEHFGSLIIPETAKEKQGRGKVIAVGAGKYNENGILIPPQAKVGDYVLFGKMSGSEVTVDGIDYLIIRDTDILGSVE